MYALLRLQFDLQKKTLLFLLVALLIILVLFSSAIPTSLPFIAFILSTNLSMTLTFLSNKNFYYLLHTMPLKRESIVKSSILSSFLLVIIIYTIVLPFQIKEGIAQENIHESAGFFIGFFSSSLLANVVQHYFIFTNEKLQISSGEHTLALVGTIFVVMVPHAIFCLIGPEETFYLRMMIMPLITCLLYYFILKIIIRHYKKKEIV